MVERRNLLAGLAAAPLIPARTAAGSLSDFSRSHSALVLSNIGALQALGPTGASLVSLAAYKVAGDGGGGHFVRVEAAEETPANGVTVIIDAAGNRWERLYTGAVDVRWAGVRCDGVTPAATAVERAAAVGPIFFPGGVTIIERDLVIEAFVEASAGAVISPASGVTVTFNAGFLAPLSPVFGGAGKAAFNPAFLTTGHPEWWGARTNDAEFDNQPSIQACVNACVHTKLQAAKYYTGSLIKITTHGRSLTGVAATQNKNSGCTELLLTSAIASGIQVGYDTQPADVNQWLEHVTVADLTIRRVAKIDNPIVGFHAAPSGLILRWSYSCYIERVLTIEHSIGFYIFGTVHNYFRYCESIRNTAGTVPDNDFFAGFFMDNSAQTEFSSGNASLYIQNCSVFSTQSVAFTECSGIRSYQGFTDTFITNFESGMTQYGLNMNGRIDSHPDYETEDLIVADCVIDSPTVAGILIRTGTPDSAIQISNCYIAPSGAGIGISVYDTRGSTSITGCQLIAPPKSATVGLSVRLSSGVSSVNNIYTDIRHPIVIENSDNCRLMDTISAPQQTSAVAAVNVIGLNRGFIACIVKGMPKANPIGVNLGGASNGYIEVNCTGIDASCIAGGSANKLVCNGARVTSTGLFSKANLASGIMA